MLLPGDIGRLKQLPDGFSGDVPVIAADGKQYRTILPQASSNLNNRVIVSQASDLAGTLSSNKDYFIDGQIDMGTTQIKVPEGGLNISGYNFDNSGLFSSEDNYTMFVKEDSAAYAGYLRCQNIYINVTGVSSALFDLDNQENNNAVEFLNCNIGLFSGALTSLGELSNYRLFRTDGCAFIRVADGLTLSGNMAQGIVIDNTIGLSLPAMTLLKEGTSLVMNGDSRSNANMNSVNSAFVFADIDEANITNDGGFRLNGFRTTASDALPNLPPSSVKAVYQFCEGITDTYPGAELEVTTGATTVIVTAGTAVKIAGITTASQLSSFDDDGGTNNRLRYISDLERQFIATALGEFTGGNNDVMRLEIRKYNSSDVFQEAVDSRTATLNGGAAGVRVEGLALRGYVTMNDGDYLELWGANESDTTNIVTVAGTQMVVNER